MELNNLPSFADEIRTQIGYSIRSMSIASWNKQSDIKNALALINYSLQINVNESAKSKFYQDKNELEELEKKYKGILVCHFCETNAPDNGCEINTTIYKETSRSYFLRRVEFSYSEVTIPRCRSCKEIQSKRGNINHLIFFVLIILGVIIGAATEGEHFIIGGIIGAVAAWIIVGNIIEGGIKDSSEYTLSRHPLLKEKFKNGWTFSKPIA